MTHTTLVNFYCFTPLADPATLVSQLREQLQALELLGTVLVASEGINVALSGSEHAVGAAIDWLRQAGVVAAARTVLLTRLERGAPQPFRRLKVRLRREIVTLGQVGEPERAPDAPPSGGVSRHVQADEWDQILDDAAVPVLDMRNRYEIELGQFAGAIDPGMASFRELPDIVANTPAWVGEKRVAMYCTGGIRCEKAAQVLISAGVSEVIQLDGGILRYLDDGQRERHRWQGECFVFDDRVAVDLDGRPTTRVICAHCRMPLASTEAAADYLACDGPGERCPRCQDA